MVSWSKIRSPVCADHRPACLGRSAWRSLREFVFEWVFWIINNKIMLMVTIPEILLSVQNWNVFFIKTARRCDGYAIWIIFFISNSWRIFKALLNLVLIFTRRAQKTWIFLISLCSSCPSWWHNYNDRAKRFNKSTIPPWRKPLWPLRLPARKKSLLLGEAGGQNLKLPKI